jgi:CDP-paratose 2-epimerase
MTAAAPAMITSRAPVLITGGAGFIGSNLADQLAASGEQVVVFDSLARDGVQANLDWLRTRHPRRVTFVLGDICDAVAVEEVVRGAGAVFHFAAQVAVTSSMLDPMLDCRVNLLGTLNLLEALRRNPVPVIFSSTNKVYGELDDVPLALTDDGYQPRDQDLARAGIAEDRRLDFRTPYGCSKGAADQYVLDYARNFAIPSAVLRMSCIYGPRQLGTEDQGWVAHFLLRALAGEPITIYGDGRQVRDVLHVDDAVRAYIAAWRGITRIAGQAFNLGGGPANAVCLLSLLRHVRDLLGRDVPLRFADWRPNDQRWFVTDPRRVRAELGLPRPIEWRSGVGSLLRWLAAGATMREAQSA